MRTMYDAANGASVPADGDLYAGYVDGNYRSYPVMVARFPGKLVIPIAVNTSTNAGTIFDGPPDNATWPGVVAWVQMRRRAGVDPTVYTDLSSWTTGMAAFRAAGEAYPHWWIANWNGTADVPAGMVAHQYRSVSGKYDTSAVLDVWPGVDGPGTPAGGSSGGSQSIGSALTIRRDDDMSVIVSVTPSGSNNPGIYLVSGSLVVGIPSQSDASALAAAGVPQATVSYAMWQNLQAASAALSGALSGSLAVSGNLNVGSASG